MPNISETGRETFTKFSGVLGVIHRIPRQNMEWICPPNFGGKGGKVEHLTPISPKWEVRGAQFFGAVGAFEYSKIKS